MNGCRRFAPEARRALSENASQQLEGIVAQVFAWEPGSADARENDTRLLCTKFDLAALSPPDGVRDLVGDRPTLWVGHEALRPERASCASERRQHIWRGEAAFEI